MHASYPSLRLWPKLAHSAASPLQIKPASLGFDLLPRFFPFLREKVVGQNGLEPSTSRLSVVCSSQLSYWPISQLPSPAPPSSLSHRFTASRVPSKLNNVSILHLADLRISARASLQRVLLRKEVIQPHLPIRLPCYDFTPIIRPTFGRAPLAVRLRTSGVPNSHGVTGGVYKARERIHRGMLIHDY